MCQSSVPNMILTVTLNAAIDKRYVVEGYQVGEVNRVKECAYTPGGKGLNVSKPASIAGAEVVATGFVGGHAGNYIEDALKPFGIKSEFYHLEEESRSCINIWDEVNHVQTEFLEPGFTVSEEEFKGFEKHFTELVKKADVVAMSGSVPKGLDGTAYQRLVRICKEAGKKVILRTLDIGSDKQVDYFGLDKEDNPAMGYRAIRICLDRREVFKTQLRALYRASYYGTIAIMFPMIISVTEVQTIKKIIEEVKKELDEEKIPYKDVELGIMIETPAAVMMSEELAQEVDFFSVGTNDLTQYTLAIDRQNPKLDNIYDSHHPAILKMLKMIVDNGHKGGCWVGICGELGADTTLTETFLSMGYDELSVSPSMILKVRQEIRSLDLKA